jgi:hypothetical protein
LVFQSEVRELMEKKGLVPDEHKPKRKKTRKTKGGSTYPATKCKEDAPEAGAVAFDWAQYAGAFGQVVRRMHNLDRLYRAKESPTAKGLRRKLNEFHGDRVDDEV